MYALNCITRRFPAIRSFRARTLSQDIEISQTLSQLHFSISYLKTGCVYVHWPYCEKKCTYCDFNKYVSPNVDHERMKNCIVDEIGHQLQDSSVKNISSVFFGGGTPSLALPSTIEVGRIYLHFVLDFLLPKFFLCLVG